MCRALGSSRTREKEPCDRVLSLPCGFHISCLDILRVVGVVLVIGVLVCELGYVCLFSAWLGKMGALVCQFVV